MTTLPTCGPPLLPPPALKRWGPPGQQGLCSHLAHLWATCESAPRSEAVATPQAVWVYVATLPTYGPPLFLPPDLKRWGIPGGMVYVTTLPTFGPPLLPPPALKRWGNLRRQGLCNHLAHL